MNNKDWTGNKNSIFKTLGASNHTDKERQNEDYYATDPIAIDTCMGSNTTGLACKNLNRRYIGIEKDPEYFKIAENRMANC